MRAHALDLMEPEPTEANSEIEELVDMFSGVQGISQMYEQFGYWKTYHLLDLTCNHNQDLAEIMLLGKRDLTRKVYDTKFEDVEECMLIECTRYTSCMRNAEPENVLYAGHKNNPKGEHYNEHVFTRMLD